MPAASQQKWHLQGIARFLGDQLCQQIQDLKAEEKTAAARRRELDREVHGLASSYDRYKHLCYVHEQSLQVHGQSRHSAKDLEQCTVRAVILQKILNSQTLTRSWRQVFKLFILLFFLFDA
eukprot:s3510_g12.t1